MEELALMGVQSPHSPPFHNTQITNMSKTTSDLIRIAANGGGMIIDSTKTTDDLIRIAANAAGKATVIIRNAGSKTTDDLIRIAANGKGSVIFEL